MKFFIVVIALAAIIALEAKEDFEPKKKECAQKNNLKEDDVKKIFFGDIKVDDASQDMKCFAMCLTENGGITKGGQFDASGTTEGLSKYTDADKAKIDEIVSACKDLKGVDNCETSFLILKCISEKVPRREM